MTIRGQVRSAPRECVSSLLEQHEVYELARMATIAVRKWMNEYETMVEPRGNAVSVLRVLRQLCLGIP